jgi:Pseudopilin GspJ./Protein of unknown function (DUF1494).
MNKCLYSITKRPVTLLELLISIALTVIILMTLMFFYRQVVTIGIETDKIMADNFRMRYVESRLARILPKTVAVNDEKKDFVFFSVGDEGVTKPGSQSLIFTFDNGVSLDKVMANHVLGRLYLDKDNNLMLAYWPSPKRWEGNTPPPIKKEVLMEGVENLRFEFYIPPEKSIEKTASNDQPTDTPAKPDKNPAPKKSADEEKKPKPEPKGDWRRQLWLKEYESLPAMVRVIVTMPKETKPMEFAFPIATAKEHVIYD